MTSPEEKLDETVERRRRRTTGRRLVTSLPDELLAERLREGDRRAFRLLYDRHFADVTHLAAFILGSNEEAEDVAQEVFFEIYVKASQLRYPAKFRPWMFSKVYGIAKRRRSRLRRFMERVDLRKFHRDSALDAGSPMASATANPEQRAMVLQTYEVLQDLSIENRTAWILYSVWGHTYSEIAILTNASRSSVRRRIGRARDLVMKAI